MDLIIGFPTIELPAVISLRFTVSQQSTQLPSEAINIIIVSHLFCVMYISWAYVFVGLKLWEIMEFCSIYVYSAD